MYNTEWKDKRGETVKGIDLPRFAADLAKALGGKVLPPPKDREFYDPHNEQQIDVGADRLSLDANNYQGRDGKVSVSICAPEIGFGDHPHTNDKSRTESARINPNGRGLDIIAKDIRKRVIDASQAALAYRREYARERANARNGIAQHMAELSKLCPTLDVKRQSETDETATIWNRGGAYIAARLNANGTVYIDRIETTTLDKFARIVAILNEGKKEG